MQKNPFPVILIHIAILYPWTERKLIHNFIQPWLIDAVKSCYLLPYTVCQNTYSCNEDKWCCTSQKHCTFVYINARMNYNWAESVMCMKYSLWASMNQCFYCSSFCCFPLNSIQAVYKLQNKGNAESGPIFSFPDQTEELICVWGFIL